MSLCVAAAGKTILLVATSFNLSWTHSVEKVTWQEDWQVTAAGLSLLTARVKGSGAGMEPGEGAILRQGWWEWQPKLAPQQELVLAASGATSSGWRLCIEDGFAYCLDLAQEPTEAIKLWSCSALPS
ncbi:DUF1850 domain-containing protein [Thiothrix eikelboomii]|uniref:DUF1850 domain-containing protein n=1 Tax=Thiothrix eikelboomii TaxID=92487 RepID=UPI003BAEC1AE